MKSSERRRSNESLLAAVIMSCACEIFAQHGLAQNIATETETEKITLQKTVVTREHNGQNVEGQERVVRPGDSLWRMLIQENNLPEKRFGEYLGVVRRLNPQLKTVDVLRVGEKIFVPLRPDEALGNPPASVKAEISRPATGATKDYAIKPGDYLTKLLRGQLKITDEKTLLTYVKLTKDLNPQKKNWDLLQPGETIRLPDPGDAPRAPVVADRPPTPSDKKAAATVSSQPAPVSTAESKAVLETPPAIPPSAPPAVVSSKSLDYTREAAKENVSLISEVVASLGNEIQSSGEEIVAIKDGSLRFERRSFPVVYNRILSQKILLDPEQKIPDSLRVQLNEKMNGASVITIGKSSSVEETVSQVLARLGFQALPTQKTVVIQEGGVAFEAKGQWVVLAPEENNKPQDVYVINISDKAGAVPEYLKSHLAVKGLHLREIVWPPSAKNNFALEKDDAKASIAEAKWLPRDKREIVDALLLSYGIPFGVKVGLSWELGQGLKVETACDRVFEWRGQQTAVFFQRVGSEMKKSLQEKQDMKIVELDLASMSSRDLVGKLLSELGEQAAYREQRFPAASGTMQDKFTVITSGFLLPKKAVFMTDREVPEEFRRFFFEKGWQIVYFQ